MSELDRKLGNLSKKELEVLIRETKVNKALNDLWYLNQLMGHKDVTREVYGDLLDLLQKGDKSVLIQMPRGSLKTEIVESYMIWRLLHNPNLRILYILETKTKALAYLKGVKDHIEDPAFIEIFGNIKDEGVWREDGIRVKGRTLVSKEHSIMCGSLESSTLTGFHFELIIADDLHSEANTRTTYQIDMAKGVFTELTNLGLEGSRKIVVGTPWRDNDIYSSIVQSLNIDWQDGLKKHLIETDYWSVYLRSALDDGDETITIDGLGDFPNSKIAFPKVNLEVLKQKWKEPLMSRYVFSCHYLCNPLINKNVEFSREELQRSFDLYDAICDRVLVKTFLFVDPAYSTGRRSDFSAFIYCGYDMANILHVRMAFKEKKEISAVVDTIFSMQRVYKPSIVGIESNSTQILSKWVKDKQNEKGQHFRVTEIKTGTVKTKEQRIRALKSLFKDDKIAISREFTDLIEELSNFPNDLEHDDLIDCLSFILNDKLQFNKVSALQRDTTSPGVFSAVPGYRPIVDYRNKGA